MILNKLKIVLNFYRKNLRNYIIIRINKKKISINLKHLKLKNCEIRDIKISIINYYIHNLNLNKSFNNHLFNHLFLQNQDIHWKGCLIKYLLDKNYYNIKKISAPFLSKSDKSIFQLFNLNIPKFRSIKIRLISTSMIYLFITELVESKRARKFYNEKNSQFDPSVKYYRIIRDWKKQGAQDFYTEKLKKSLKDTLIYLKPDIKAYFKSSAKKHYIRYLRNNKQPHFEYFPKINFKNVLNFIPKICFGPFHNEIKVNLLSVIMQRMWIDGFVEYIIRNFPDIKEFYTIEDYYSGTIYLTEKLKENNIKTINFAHGILPYGGPCPIVNYDEYFLFSKIQKDYFLGSSIFRYFDLNFSPINKNKQIKKNIALFLIGSNLLSQPFSIKTFLYEKSIVFIEQIAKDFDVPVYAKYKPGATVKDKVFSKNIKIIENIEDLPKDYNFISLTLYSTLVLELLYQMPFLIFNPEGKIDMRYLFPQWDFIYIKSYQDFKEKINKFLQFPDYYFEYWNKLISMLQ